MRSFLRSFLASLLALIVLVAVVVGVVAIRTGQKPAIKDHSYLVVDLYGDLLEYDPPSDLMAEVTRGDVETLQRVLSNLAKVPADDRIDGVILKLSSSNGAGAADLEEIRGAVRAVQAVHKPVYAWFDSMDRKTYYLAAACDSVFAAPSAYISFLGLASVTEHVAGTLDKLGIQPNVHRIKDYKSAAELITRRTMSPETRQMHEWMLAENWDVFTRAMAADRGLDEQRVTDLMQKALFTAEEARQGGLIDRLLYWDELESRLQQPEDEGLRVVTQTRYAEVAPGKLGLEGKHRIAVVHAQGMIGGRQSKVDPLLGVMMGHESVVRELRRARLDKDVDAVILRVDSRGGESLASDLISRAVAVTADVKPVVTSMVDVAASGGYMISYRASRILADELTTTGSIGSITMKFNMHDLYEKLGVSADAVTRGPMALFYWDNRDWTDQERKRLEENHWEGFNRWLRDVAAHRGLTMERLQELSMGRVWTGRQAAANGLVDEIGGLDRAVAAAKELAGIPAEEKVTLVHYPEHRNLLQSLLAQDQKQGPVAATGWILHRLLRQELATIARLASEPQMLWTGPVSAE